MNGVLTAESTTVVKFWFLFEHTSQIQVQKLWMSVQIFMIGLARCERVATVIET